MLHASLHVDTIGLPLVLGDVGVHAVNDVLADGGREHVGDGQSGHGLGVGGCEQGHHRAVSGRVEAILVQDGGGRGGPRAFIGPRTDTSKV